MTPQDIEQEAGWLYLSVGMALTTWSGVEFALSRLFAQSIEPKSFHPTFSQSVSERAFWGVASFEAKLKMVSETFTEAYFSHQEFLKIWTNLENRLRKSNKYRNKVAHGTVIQHNQGQPDNSIITTVYFAPYYWNLEAKSGRMFIPTTNVESERLSYRDIQSAIQRFKTLKDEICALSVKIFQTMQPTANLSSWP